MLKNRRKEIALILLFLFSRVFEVNADILYLKNGRSIEGLIREETDDTLELDIGFGKVKFRKAEIGRIEKSKPEEVEMLRQKWERQRIESQQRIYTEEKKKEQEEKAKPKQIQVSEDSGHILVSATINKNVTAILYLDTGASLIVLTRDIAKKLGINLKDKKDAIQLVLADGRNINAKFIVLKSVKVENVEETNVEAAVILDEIGDPKFKDGVLGMSFLKRFNFKVDYKNKKLTLEKL